MQANAGVTSPGKRAALRPERCRVVIRAEESAYAVGARLGIESAVELSPMQPDRAFEGTPGPLNLGQFVCDAYEHDVDRVTHHDVLVAHAQETIAALGRSFLLPERRHPLTDAVDRG